jgi:hypothetical protein
MNTQLIGIVALAVGAVLLYFGYNASQAPIDQLSNTLTGRYTDNTMWYVVGGIAMVATGIAVTIFGRRI